MPKLFTSQSSFPAPLEQAKRKTVEVGGIYGHLEVVERVTRPGRKPLNRCICRNVVEGAECGRRCVRHTSYLTGRSFRACDRCTREHVKETRREYARGLVLAKGAGR